MNTSTSAMIDAAEFDRQRMYSILCDLPALQREAIIRHYAVHAQMAVDAYKVIEQHKLIYGAAACGLEDFIKYVSDTLITNHAHDLGIALEYKK